MAARAPAKPPKPISSGMKASEWLLRRDDAVGHTEEHVSAAHLRLWQDSYLCLQADDGRVEVSCRQVYGSCVQGHMTIRDLVLGSTV
jgi:hypothetical protein